MKNKSLGGSFCLTLAALLWGSTFVAQEVNTVGSFTFQGVRSFVGSLFLVIVIFVMTAVKKAKGTYVKPTKEDNKNLVVGGICCGLVLCLSMNLQQIGMSLGSQAGKAGFITAMYILFVPVYGLLGKKKVQGRIWACIALAVVGLFLLCIKPEDIKAGQMAISIGDFFVILCAFSFALHIIVVDRFVSKVDGVKLSLMQFVVAGAISCVLMFAFEQPTI
ncbi:MAG: DMT family transporter, partial [Clostridia bacterium]|nr:DMT family transporter [Clostridia bacterium]